jgi:hypothetical protein
MKKLNVILLVIALVFGFSATYASNDGVNPPAKTVSLTGKVIDKTNQEALVGALVKIEGTDLETYTDFEGNFSFEGLTPDIYKVKCSMISYSEFEKELEIEKSKEHFELSLENVAAN